MASITRMALRSFSTSTTANQLVRPSVPVYGVDGRYASALFSAASKSKQLDSVEKDIKLVGELLEKNKQTAGKENGLFFFIRFHFLAEWCRLGMLNWNLEPL